MGAPLSLSIEHLGNRPFSFYPAIIGIDHNEWSFRRSTWSEMLVRNRASDEEIWIPRRFIGEVSRIDEPVVIIGLAKELEYKSGMVVPHQRRIVEIPRASNDAPSLPPAISKPGPARVAGIRLEGGTESRVGRLLIGTIALGIVLCIVVVAVLSTSATRVTYRAILQADLGFTGNDDYYSIVNRFGAPAEDQWRAGQGELQYRRLSYPKQGISLILMGSDRRDMHYIGSVDKDWRTVHAINANAEAMLHTLRRF